MNIKDLLSREEFQIDIEEAKNYFRDKSILITGAGGSIGSELVRQLIVLNPRQIILFGRSEESLFYLDREVVDKHNYYNVVVKVGSITDSGRVEAVFSELKPDVVFHCAANKHVPMCESNISETIFNNIYGMKVVLDACLKHKSTFTLVSSDKGIRSASVMGASKRVCELYLKYISDFNNQAKLSIVRLGNVLGSSGSIVPILKSQIESGGPIKITHRDMKRYFMGIPEAARLIIQSAVFNKQFATYVLDMGEQIKITDLADKMIKDSGKKIDIVFTGMRPGEKLVEELAYDVNSLKPTKHERILQSADVICNEERFEKINDLFYFAKDAPPEFLKNKLTKIVY